MKTLGIDIGGTEVKIGAASSVGKISVLDSISFESDPVKLFENISRLVGNAGSYAVAGVAVAGDVDRAQGVVRFSPNLGWKNLPLANIARKILRRPVIVENDANAAAVGAWSLDCAERYGDMVCITMGTGIGGGIIVGGQLYRGSGGSAGEIGHLTYEPSGIKCSCGNRGCFERYIGRDAIVSRFRDISGGRKPPCPSEITPENVCALAARGNRAAIETWRETGLILGVLLADIVNIFNPAAMVITGGISRASRFFLPAAIREMKSRAFDCPSAGVRVFVSKNAAVLGVAGAALLAARKDFR
ncbi:MAG: ROK family protein [Endomicrobiia bacterium]|nr:ROK family protein [Endomicrobiia bacterium]